MNILSLPRLKEPELDQAIRPVSQLRFTLVRQKGDPLDFLGYVRLPAILRRELAG